MYTVFSVSQLSSFNASSVQSIASVQFFKRSVYRVESYIVNGVQC